MRLVHVLALSIPLGAAAPGCASGGNGGGRDGGRRDAPFSLPDTPGLDTPFARPDVPGGPDVPLESDAGVDAPSGASDVPVVDAPVSLPDTPAMMLDTGPPPECTSAATCSDGNACNGIERCELGRCVAGTPLTCDDGVACTIDTCSGGACSYTPNDGLCGSGQRCTATGCMSSTTSCNPVRQTGCTGGLACTIFTTGPGMYTTECAGPVGFGEQYDFCFDETDCAAGHACLDPDGFGDACLHWCNVATGEGCSPLYSCYGFTDPVIVGGVQYGVCA
jgi:hypothetical protein